MHGARRSARRMTPRSVSTPSPQFRMLSDVFFFFQAEDGIRDHCVTGVQTCALPILAEKAAKEPREVKVVDESAIEKEMLGLIEQELRSAYAIPVKQDRYAAVGKAKEKVMAHYFPEGQEPKYDKLRIAAVFKELEAKIVRWNILDTGKRIDGRDSKTVRNIVAEVGVLPRAHGSALFTRGETQAMVVTTLGTGEDEQYIDSLSATYKETFLLHYNFPPYSVGETGRLGGTKRREIGHGKLAWPPIQ